MEKTEIITIAICNFNTTELTNNCIRSIHSRCKSFQSQFIIFDNSDKIPFQFDDRINANVSIIDNTKGKIINFDKIMQMSPYKLMSFNANNFGSLKHACSIQFLLNICQTDYMMLFDSDTVLLNDIDFIDSKYASIADFEEHGKIGRNGKLYTSFTRMLPFIQFFNIKLLKNANIKYFDYTRIHGILAPNYGNYYDTGASFYEDLTKNNLPIKRINHTNYIVHLDHGSWFSIAKAQNKK